jgi:hypothetical protein
MHALADTGTDIGADNGNERSMIALEFRTHRALAIPLIAARRRAAGLFSAPGRNSVSCSRPSDREAAIHTTHITAPGGWG